MFNLKVNGKAQDVDVAPDGMRNVAAADGETVAVAAGHEHEEFRVGEFDALGDGQ